MWSFKKKQPKFIRKSRKFDFTGEKARQILIMADKAFNDKRYNVDRFDLWAYIKSLIEVKEPGFWDTNYLYFGEIDNETRRDVVSVIIKWDEPVN